MPDAIPALPPPALSSETLADLLKMLDQNRPVTIAGAEGIEVVTAVRWQSCAVGSGCEPGYYILETRPHAGADLA